MLMKTLLVAFLGSCLLFVGFPSYAEYYLVKTGRSQVISSCRVDVYGGRHYKKPHKHKVHHYKYHRRYSTYAYADCHKTRPIKPRNRAVIETYYAREYAPAGCGCSSRCQPVRC